MKYVLRHVHEKGLRGKNRIWTKYMRDLWRDYINIAYMCPSNKSSQQISRDLEPNVKNTKSPKNSFENVEKRKTLGMNQ